MAVKDQIVCHVCGFANKADVQRCQSCGAKLETLQNERTSDDQANRKHQKDGLQLKWIAVSFGIYVVLEAIFLFALPKVISTYDPQGSAGLAVSVLAWFIGATIVGFLAPGRTFLEPAISALIIAVPTVAFVLWRTPEVPAEMASRVGGNGFVPSVMACCMMSLIGIMLAVFGGFLGGKFQPKKA